MRCVGDVMVGGLYLTFYGGCAGLTPNGEWFFISLRRIVYRVLISL